MPEEATPSGYADGDEYFATKYTQGGRIVYSIELSPAQIASTVEKPDPSTPTRTNRQIKESHANGFKSYLRTYEKRVIPPLLLRAPRNLLKFEATQTIPGTAFGKLTIPRLSRHDIEILDGQHRILGIHWEMEALSSEIKEKRSLRYSMGPDDNPDVAALLDAEIDELEGKREALGTERVTVQIVVTDDEGEVRQMFADIAINALGISQSVKSRFDQTRVVNRAMSDLVERSGLLKGRTDPDRDRMLGDNPHLVGAQHVADAIRTVLVGIGGRVSNRREDELDDAEVVADALLYVESLSAAFPEYRAVQDGSKTPAALRKESLLGSPVMFRALAGVFHRVTVTGDNRPDSSLVPEVVKLFKSVGPYMPLPISWKEGSPWTGSAALPEGEMSARSRRQDLTEIVDLICA